MDSMSTRSLPSFSDLLAAHSAKKAFDAALLDSDRHATVSFLKTLPYWLANICPVLSQL